MSEDFFYKPDLEKLPRPELAKRQRALLGPMLEEVFRSNRFYQEKFRETGWDRPPSSSEFEQLPFTTKDELVASSQAHPPYGANLTYPLDRYRRLHQTSGTTGKPLVVLDTAKSWEAWKECWRMVYRGCGVSAGDRIYVAFSFGPFIGFWSAFEAAEELGCTVISGGGQSSMQRLEAIFDYGATVLVSTPTYALYLGEVGQEAGRNLRQSAVRTTIHAGEAGASIPSTKKRIEDLWNARCYDHVGASEVGAWGFEPHLQPGGVLVNELYFICEILHPKTGKPVPPGKTGEIVLTNLNRWGFPVIRYRTGDLVSASPVPSSCGRSFLLLDGGIQGRVDDMMTVRGINVFPSSIEAVLREFKEIVEFQGIVCRRQGMDEIQLQIEPREGSSQNLVARVEEALHRRLSLRIDVEKVGKGNLPRYELKAKRFRRKP